MNDEPVTKTNRLAEENPKVKSISTAFLDLKKGMYFPKNCFEFNCLVSSSGFLDSGSTKVITENKTAAKIAKK